MKPTRILASATLRQQHCSDPQPQVSLSAMNRGSSVWAIIRLRRILQHPPHLILALPELLLWMAVLWIKCRDVSATLPYAPYFERSYGATQQIPHSAYQPTQPFGLIMMFETNIGDGLGYEQSIQ